MNRREFLQQIAATVVVVPVLKQIAPAPKEDPLYVDCVLSNGVRAVVECTEHLSKGDVLAVNETGQVYKAHADEMESTLIGIAIKMMEPL